MLNPICICSVFRFEGLLLENQVLFILHPEVPVEINIMTTADIQRVVDFTYVIRGVLNPFLKQEEVFLSAQRYLKEGFFIEAVTYAQMMMDEFLRTLYVQLLIAEGKTEAEADSTRENTPFLAIVKQGLHGRIGGQWQINRTGTVVSDWYSNPK